MPAQYRIDVARGLVLSVISGVITADEMRTHSHRLAADPDFDPSYRQLADLRGVTEFAISTSELAAQSRVSPWTKGARRAFVAGQEEVFGMLRMFELLTGSDRPTTRVFREMSEALVWLDLDSIN